MILAGRLVLPPEVELLPVDALPPETRALFAHEATDFVLSRTHARDVTRVIDASSAALLSRFRVARTVADAVIDFSHTTDADPESVLADAWPLITRLVEDRLLVPEDDRADRATEPRLVIGSHVEQWSVVRRLYMVDDTEVYQVQDAAGQWFALKVARHPTPPHIVQWFDHEAAVLERLGGGVAPRLRRRGMIGESPFLLLDWCMGSGIETVAAEWRALPHDARRASLLTLAIALLDAYDRLHAKGIVHGDVHPKNVLVDRDGRLTVLDFAFARRLDADDSDVRRAGVAFYFEPELAGALLDATDRPSVTESGEQYALAALLYLLFTGEHYQDFQLEQRAFLASVRDGPMLPFSARGIDPWPEVEATLARALSKAPTDRFPSIAAFADAMRQLDTSMVTAEHDVPASADTDVGLLERHTPDDGQRMLLGDLLTRAGYGQHQGRSRPMPLPPTASLMHGAAGLAYALYRIALVRDDAVLMALADSWAMRALAVAHEPDAFADETRGLTSAIHSDATPYHTIAGVHAMRALIANAAGDRQSLSDSVDAFIAASPVPTERPDVDLMLGHVGVLLACSLLLDALAPIHTGPRARLTYHGGAVMRAVREATGRLPSMQASRGFAATGAAHGWTGVLYPMLRWCAVERSPAPADIVGRLRELAACGEPWGRGMRWPQSLDPDTPERRSYRAGWCNGSAGLVHLWTLAARVTGDATFDDLADRAAWGTWEHASDAIANICCGLAGMAYALLLHYRTTDDRAWLRRASTLAARAARVTAAEPPPYPDSLYHGTVGIALLIADLERPLFAAMPVFGEEGWRWQSAPPPTGGRAG